MGLFDWLVEIGVEHVRLYMNGGTFSAPNYTFLFFLLLL